MNGNQGIDIKWTDSALISTRPTKSFSPIVIILLPLSSLEGIHLQNNVNKLGIAYKDCTLLGIPVGTVVKPRFLQSSKSPESWHPATWYVTGNTGLPRHTRGIQKFTSIHRGKQGDCHSHKQDGDTHCRSISFHHQFMCSRKVVFGVILSLWCCKA